MKKAILYINEQDYLTIEAMYTPLWYIEPWSPLRITIHAQREQYILFDDGAGTMPRDFANLLENLLENNRPLDESIMKNVGLMWNRIEHGETNFVFEKQIWPGLRNRGFSTPIHIQPSTSTWLYNNSNGTSTLEVTENYFWHHVESDKGEDYEPYETFIKNYAPLIKLELSKEIIQTWFEEFDTLACFLEQKIEKKERQEYEELKKREQEKKLEKEKRNAKRFAKRAAIAKNQTQKNTSVKKKR